MFFNEKQKGSKAPDLNGSFTVHGEKFFVKAWMNEPKNGGDEYVGFVIQTEEERNDEIAAYKAKQEGSGKSASGSSKSGFGSRKRAAVADDEPEDTPVRRQSKDAPVEPVEDEDDDADEEQLTPPKRKVAKK